MILLRDLNGALRLDRSKDMSYVFQLAPVVISTD